MERRGYFIKRGCTLLIKGCKWLRAGDLETKCQIRDSPALLFTDWVNLGKLLNLCGLQLQQENNDTSYPLTVCED
jgi:hypothetical protein